MAFNSSLVLSALTAYVDQISFDQILTEIVLKGRTGTLVQNQRGIKNARTINTTISSLIIQPAGCGLISPTGSVTLNQQTLTVCPLMVQESICLVGAGGLEQYWLGMKMPEGSNYDSLTPDVFAKAYMADKINKLQDANEMLVWQGSTTGASFGTLPTYQSVNADQCNGFLQILTQTSASMSVVLTGTAYSGALAVGTAIAAVDYIVDTLTTQLPNLLDQADLYMFMSFANYRTYVRALRNANYYHFGAMEDADTIGWSILIPGTNIRAVATSGLVGSTYIVTTTGSNLYIGTDGVDEQNSFEIWKSQDYNTIFFRSMWKLGVVVAYPQYVVLYD
jgi:hypothetical protein